MTQQIYLVRHGETEWSRTGQHTGRSDVPLTAEGQRTAVLLGARLQRLRFDHVFSSPLERARKTCELAGLAAHSRLDDDLQEWDYGDYEGITTAQIRLSQPSWNVFEHGCPNGESVEQVSQRADAVVRRLRAVEGVVAVFSHGHFLRTLAVRWLGLAAREGRHFPLDTASLSCLGYERHSSEVATISLWNAPAVSDVA